MNSTNRMRRWTTVTVELPRERGSDSVLVDAISYGQPAIDRPVSKSNERRTVVEAGRRWMSDILPMEYGASDEPSDEPLDTLTLRNELRDRLGAVAISSEHGNLVVRVGQQSPTDPGEMVFDPTPVVDSVPDGVDRFLTLEFDPDDGTVGRLYERDGPTASLLETYHGRPRHHATDVVADVYRDHEFRGGTRSHIDTTIRRSDVALLVRTGDTGVRLHAAQDCWEKHTSNIHRNPTTGETRTIVREPFDAAERALLLEAIEDPTELTVVRGWALKALAGHVLNPYLTVDGSERSDETVERAIAAQDGPTTGSFDLGIDPEQAETVLEIIATWLEADTRDDRDDDRTRDATAALWVSPHWDLYASADLRRRIWTTLDRLGVRTLVENGVRDGALFNWPYR